MPGVHLSAKADYALRAAVHLAGSPDRPVKGDAIARAQGIPAPFLGAILRDLREAGIVRSQRGAEGGYWLAAPAAETTLADVIRAIDGPLAWVRGVRPEDLEYAGAARVLQDVWIAVRANLRDVLEAVTLADVAGGVLPDRVTALTADPAAWEPH
jgi:Rrf2 family protein